MKALYFNGSYYQHPEGVKTIEEFIEHINQKGDKYLPMTRYETENCVHPYYIREEMKIIYINFSQINEIEETEIHVLVKDEYEIKLAKCVEDVCRYCANYEEDSSGNMKGHRDKINLDGECFFKQDI